MPASRHQRHLVYVFLNHFSRAACWQRAAGQCLCPCSPWQGGPGLYLSGTQPFPWILEMVTAAVCPSELLVCTCSQGNSFKYGNSEHPIRYPSARGQSRGSQSAIPNLHIYAVSLIMYYAALIPIICVCLFSRTERGDSPRRRINQRAIHRSHIALGCNYKYFYLKGFALKKINFARF